jgi:hypothetical protein
VPGNYSKASEHYGSPSMDSILSRTQTYLTIEPLTPLTSSLHRMAVLQGTMGNSHLKAEFPNDDVTRSIPQGQRGEQKRFNILTPALWATGCVGAVHNSHWVIITVL